MKTIPHISQLTPHISQLTTDISIMKIFFAFVKKEIYHILRDRRTLAILFGMPIALVLIFGYTVTNEFRGASITILDKSHDDLSRKLQQHLLASGHFQLADQVEDEAALEKSFKAGKVKMGIIIPADFEQQFFKEKSTSVQLIADASEPNYATTLVNYASQMILSFQKEHGGIDKFPYQINVASRMVYNSSLVSAYNFIPGVIALILMLISAMMTSLTIAREKELGTMDLLLVSPLPPILIIIGKVTPYILLAFIDAVIVLAMGYFIFGVPILGNLLLLLALVIIYLITALALGVLISTRVETQQAAMMFSLFSLLLPTMLLSGFIFPISSMPVLLQRISTVIPATYFIDSLKGIMLKGVGMGLISSTFFILMIMTSVLLFAAWRNFKVVYK